jgi:hypothetical protein
MFAADSEVIVELIRLIPTLIWASTIVVSTGTEKCTAFGI